MRPASRRAHVFWYTLNFGFQPEQKNNDTMKLSVFILDIILMLSIALPYYLFIRAGRKGKQIRNKIINNITRKQGIHPNIQEQWGNYYIGIDSLENSLIYIRFSDTEAVHECVPLDKVHECSLIKEVKSIRKAKVKEDVLIFLAMELQYRQPGTKATRLVFYDAASMTGEDYEMQRAQKWVGIIKEHLKTKRHDTVAA